MRFCAPILILREPVLPFTVIVPVVQLATVSLLLNIWLFGPVATIFELFVNSAEDPVDPIDTLLFIVTVVVGSPSPKDTVLPLPAVMVVFVRSGVPTRLTLPDTVNIVLATANLLISVLFNVKLPVTLIVFWEDVLMTTFVIAKSPVTAMVPPPSITVAKAKSGLTVMPLATAI